MKKMKCTLAWILALFMTFSGIPAVGNATVYAKKQVKAKTITLNKTSYTLKKGKKLKLKANILPKKSTQKKITWSSSKKQVATVSKKGEVKAKKNGTTIITAKIKGTKKKATCKITVGTPVTSVKLSSNAKKLKVGEKFDLKATVLPAKATTKTVNYTSSDKTIAEVTKSGRVTAKKVGNAIITVSSKDGTNKRATCNVQVIEDNQTNQVQQPDQTQKPDQAQEEKDVKVKRVTLNRKTLYFYEDSEPEQLKVTVTPTNATNKNITWSSENEEIAKVTENGMVTPGTVSGITKITATATDGSGQKATCKVNVKIGENSEEDQERLYGDLKITKIQINDFVEEAKIEGSNIRLKVSSDNIKDHLKEIIPEIKEENAKYKVEYDDFDDECSIIISNEKGLEREYSLDIHGHKEIKAFEKNDNVKDYMIDSYSVYLYMKHTDLKDEKVLESIKPEIEDQSVTYKIEYKEEACEYQIILTDKNGETKSYGLYASTYGEYDNEKNNIIGMKSSDSRVTKVEFGKGVDNPDYICIYGTVDDFDEIKDTFTYELGEDVEKCSKIQQDFDCDGGITLTSKYGGAHYYQIFYYYDYGTLNISKITSKDTNIVDECNISRDYYGGDRINFVAKDIKEDIPNIIETYFNFEYGKNTITGKLVKEDNDYKYVITDRETNQTRAYKINYEFKYSENYSVTGIGQKGLTDYLDWYDISEHNISISGTAETLDEMLDEIEFQYGKDVLSGEITEKDGNKFLVLKCKNGIIRKYRIWYDECKED